MPELPEVETIRRTLDPLLRDRTIASADVLWERTIGRPGPEAFAHAVIGQSIAAIDRRAKFIVLRFSSADVLTVHLRMTGELRFAPCGSPPEESPHLRVMFQFTDGSQLRFHDTRKFGRIELLAPAEYEALSQSLGSEPLDDAFSAERLAKILHARRRMIKPLLLDQAVVAGLGNIYVDEALFRAGIHPLSHSSAISDDLVVRLHAAIVEVLSEAIDHRGTTLRDYRSGLGEAGENRTRLRIYGRRDGTPCEVCGSPVRRIVVNQRGTVYCPSCQPLIGDG